MSNKVREYSCPNVFFWIPSDASPETRGKIIEDSVSKLWINKALPKNGGWSQPDPGQGRQINVTVMGPIREIPDWHSMYSPGMDTYLVRNPKQEHLHFTDDGLYSMADGRRYNRCNKIMFHRDREIKVTHVPDKVARQLADQGAVTPLSWDDPLGPEATGETTIEKPVTPDGPRERTVIPF